MIKEDKLIEVENLNNQENKWNVVGDVCEGWEVQKDHHQVGIRVFDLNKGIYTRD